MFFAKEAPIADFITKSYLFYFIIICSFINICIAGDSNCPVFISNIHELQAINEDPNGWYILINDVDANITHQWNNGAGFEPIGDSYNPFTGIFDGQCYEISNLYIDRPDTNMVGLFGYINSGAVVKNVSLINADVTAKRNSGILVGYSTGATVKNSNTSGTIQGIYDDQMRLGGLIGTSTGPNSFVLRCYSKANVYGLGGAHQVGGLAGYNGHGSVISDCYATGEVTGTLKVGGLVGDNLEEIPSVGTLIERCYSVGKVNGTGGGLVGFNFNGGVTVDSYWNTETSGKLTSYGGTDSNTLEMKKQSTYINWDFNNVWGIIENLSYPYLIDQCNDINNVAVTYYVDDDGLNDPGPWDSTISDPCEDGSIEHPFDSIQEAIDQAYIDFNGVCDCNDLYPVVIVKRGWYEGNGNFNIDTLGLNIYLKAEDGPWWTIIAPWWQGRGFIFKNNETNCTVLDGFLVLAGEAIPSGLFGGPYKLGGSILCKNSGPVIKNCVMLFNYADNSGGAIYLYKSNPIISNCEVLFNWCNPRNQGTGGGIYSFESNPLIRNSVIAGNYGYYSGGISSNEDSNSVIENCTIADNYAHDGPDGLECYDNGHAEVINCIFWTDTFWWRSWWQQNGDSNAPPRKHLFIQKDSSMSIAYTNIEGGENGVCVIDPNFSWLDWGIGNMNTDPCFARYFGFYDYHLKSAKGRWSRIYESNGDYNNDKRIDFLDFAIFGYYWQKPNPPQYIDLNNDNSMDYNDLDIFCSRWLGRGENYSGWVTDDVNSPCIDAGDPCSPYHKEPLPNGCRVNLGAYGNTPQASKSQCGSIIRRSPDLSEEKDGVNFIDFAIFAEYWLEEGDNIIADFNYDKIVDQKDLREFSLWWLWGT